MDHETQSRKVQLTLCLLLVSLVKESCSEKDALQTSNELSMGSCECRRANAIFHVLRAILVSSDISHLTVISDPDKQGCGDLGSLSGVLTVMTCSEWNLVKMLHFSDRTTLQTFIVNCDTPTTQAILRSMLEARSFDGVERKLLLPFYNVITTTHYLYENTTTGLDVTGIHFVMISAGLHSTFLQEATSYVNCRACPVQCDTVKYTVMLKRGFEGWAHVGTYQQNHYQGDPAFLRSRLANFEGTKFKVTHTLYSPFTMRKNGVYHGFCVDLLDTLAGYLNFTYEFVYSIDKKFGVKKPDGQWNGMIGMMERKEVDMIMAGLTITALRETVVDFTLPFFEEPSAVLVQADVHVVQIPWSYLFDPLKLPVWLAAAGSLLLCTVLVYLIQLLSLHANRYNPTCRDGKPRLGETAWSLISIYAKQAVVRVPSAGSLQVALGAFWLLPLLVGWMYGANLTASLATSSITPPFQTLEQLANDTHYVILLNAGGAQRLLLENSRSGVYAALWAKIAKTKEESFVSTSKKGLEKVFDDSNPKKYAVISDRTSLQTKLARDYPTRCDWAFIPEPFFKSGFGIALPEASPYKDIFNRGIIATLSAGLTSKYRERNFYNNHCDRLIYGTQKQYAKIGLDHTKTIFSILIGGMYTACVVFFMERCKTHFKLRSSPK